jgi:hypothetical protein
MDFKKEYIRIISEKTLLKEEDFSHTEKEIANIGFGMVKEKIDEIRELNDEILRLKIEISNLKSYSDDKDY